MMISPSSGQSSTALRSAGAPSSSTSPSAATRPVTMAERPVNMAMSPVNCCGSWTTMTRGSPLDRSRHLDGAADHDIEAEPAVAFVEQHIAGTHRATMAAGLQSCDLGVSQFRKGDVFVGDHLSAELEVLSAKWKC